MTQPAKVQEPSMEEILASIRRIIADDEAKPSEAKPAEAKPAAAKPKPPAAKEPRPEPPAAKPPVMKDIPPSAIAPTAKPAAAQAAPPPAPEPAANNNQDDIDAMLASLDAATPEADIRPAQPEATCSNSPTRWHCRIRRRRRASSFHKIEPQDDIEFTESAAAKALHRQPAYEPPPFESAAARRAADPVALDRVRGRIRLQFAGQYRAEQQRADAGRSGQGNAAADAEILARRQSAGIGGADRQGRNRAGFARAGRPGRTLPGRSGPHSATRAAFIALSALRPVDLVPSGGFLARFSTSPIALS